MKPQDSTRLTQEKDNKKNPCLPIGGGQARLLPTKEGGQVVKICGLILL